MVSQQLDHGPTKITRRPNKNGGCLVTFFLSKQFCLSFDIFFVVITVKLFTYPITILTILFW